MISGLFIALLLVLFLGLTVWAYSGRRRDDFQAAARLAVEDGTAHPSTEQQR